MKNNLIILLLVLFGLTACMVSPQYLGFSKAEWESMDSEKRAQVIRSYRELHSTKQVVTTENPALAEEQNTAPSNRVINVLIARGKAMMPPFTESYAYQPVAFRIQQGSCRQVLLEEVGGKHKVEMQVCFQKGVLLLDPSHYDSAKVDSSARLYRSPLWRSGFNYMHINTSGYVRLRDATIRIHG